LQTACEAIQHSVKSLCCDADGVNDASMPEQRPRGKRGGRNRRGREAAEHDGNEAASGSVHKVRTIGLKVTKISAPESWK